MKEFVELTKWCFKDESSGLCTIIVLGVIFGGIVSIIRALKGKDD